MDTLSHFGEDYVRRRIQSATQSTPVFEIEARRTDYLPLLGEVPRLGHHEFLIDWNFPPSEISKELKSWVTQRSAEQRGTKAKQARLRWLAAYRLQQAGIKFSATTKLLECRRREAPMDSRLDVLPKYVQQADWNEAIEKAEKLLKGDFVQAIRSDYSVVEKSQMAE